MNLIAKRYATSEQSLGEVLQLCLNNRIYTYWTIESIGRVFLPPIITNQYYFFSTEESEKQNVSAFVTWAWLDDLDSSRIKYFGYEPNSDKWNSGNNLWIIDLISPIGMTLKIARFLQKNEFINVGLPYAYALRRDFNSDIYKISKWPLINE